MITTDGKQRVNPAPGIVFGVVLLSVVWPMRHPHKPPVPPAAAPAVPPPAVPAPTGQQHPAWLDPEWQRVIAPSRQSILGPSLRLADTLFDWGVVAAGATIVHTFVLHNDGGGALHIARARPIRGCAAVVFDRDILPGGEGRIEVTIGGHLLEPGRAMIHVDLLGDDGRSGASLLLTGRVEAPTTVGAADLPRAPRAQ